MVECKRRARGRAGVWLRGRSGGQETFCPIISAENCRLHRSRANAVSRRATSRERSGNRSMPPHQWLLKVRVERAKEQLLNSDASLADIAVDSGFADQSHFTRVFTKHVGASPGQWRRQFSSGPAAIARESEIALSSDRFRWGAAASSNSAGKSRAGLANPRSGQAASNFAPGQLN